MFSPLVVALLAAASVSSGPAAPSVATSLQALFRDVACGVPETPGAPLPSPLDRDTTARHCETMARGLARWRRRWANPATPMLAKTVPADAPDKVVYPFGGGDLLTALITFPRASEITTLSLEPAGDARAFFAQPPAEARRLLDMFRADVLRLIQVSHSKTTNMLELNRERFAGELSFALFALAALDFVPVEMRHFAIQPDGQLRPFAEIDLDERAHTANVEITFRPRAGGPVRVYRHIAGNLADSALAKTPGLLTHLQSKGPVSAMTKAASFLLWGGSFSKVRSYLLEHAAFMISDATGIPPRLARAAGFSIETYGRFTGPFLPGTPPAVEKDVVALWAQNPQRPLGFMFGYPDVAGNRHMMVLRRPPPAVTSK